MKTQTLATVGAILIALTALSACGNTIRGIGQDTANTVNATQAAGKKVVRAAN
ncbi:MAG: entericidin [Ensifer adhaerens]